MPMRPSELVEQEGGSYARELGIALSEAESAEVQKWFLAALLFGARISEKVAANTYREFKRARLLSPHRITAAGWDALVAVLDRGGYARYDFKTATKLLDVHQSLLDHYHGDLNVLHRSARDSADLEQRLKQLGKGIGDVTVNIFLRELRGIWKKAERLPSARAIQAAQALGFVSSDMWDPEQILHALKAAWRKDRMKAADFADFEAALVRATAGPRRKSATGRLAKGKRSSAEDTRSRAG